MATFSAANVTYTLNYKRRDGNSKVHNNVTIAFGNGTIQYATGGVPLSGGAMGCPNNIESIDIVDVTLGTGYLFYFDTVNTKLKVYTAGSHNHTVYVATNAGTSATTALNAGTLGGLFVSGGTQAIAGVAAATGTLGGIVSAQPATALTEVANTTAIVAVSLIVEVIGW